MNVRDAHNAPVVVCSRDDRGRATVALVDSLHGTAQYEVTLSRSPEGLSATCRDRWTEEPCKARCVCYHVLAVLLGERPGLYVCETLGEAELYGVPIYRLTMPGRATVFLVFVP